MVASPTAKAPNLIDRQYFRLYGSFLYFVALYVYFLAKVNTCSTIFVCGLAS